MVSDSAETTAAAVGPNQEGRRADRPEATTKTEGMTEIEKAKFTCIRNATYHEDRASHFAFMHRVFMFLVVAVGTASIGASISHENFWATAGTAVAVLAGLFDLLWNVDGMARLHSGLRSRCYDLLARLEAGESPATIRTELLRIVGEEPPAMYAVDAIAFNRAVDAMGRDQGQKYQLKDWQVFLRNCWRFRPNQFPTLDDIAKAKGSRKSSAIPTS